MISLKKIFKIYFALFAVSISSFVLWAGIKRGLEDGMQGMVTFVLLLIILVLPILICTIRVNSNLETKFDFFQPGMIVAVFVFTYIFIPATFSWYNLNYFSISFGSDVYNYSSFYNHALLLIILSLLFFGVGYKFQIIKKMTPKVVCKNNFYTKRKRWPNDKILIPTIIILLFVGFIVRLEIIHRIVGISDLLSYLSPSTQRETNIQISGIIILTSSFLDWGAILLTFRCIVRKGSIIFPGFVLIVASASGYMISGKRSYIAIFFILPIIWYHYIRKRIDFNRGVIYLFSGISLMAILLLIRILGPISLRSDYSSINAIEHAMKNPVGFYLRTPEFSLFDVTLLSISKKEKIIDNIGGWANAFLEYNFLPLLYIMPRFLWEGKPTFYDLGNKIYLLYYGYENGVGLSVGIFAGFYLFGGVLGLVFGMFFLGRLLRYIYYKLQPYNRDPSSIFVYGLGMWILFMLLRYGTLGFVWIFIIQNLAPGVFLAFTFFRPSQKKINNESVFL